MIISMSGKRQMEISKIHSLRMLTHWHSLFPIDSFSVLHLLKDVVRDLYMLGLSLNIPQGVVKAVEEDFPANTDRRRREIVTKWMSSTQNPPCWWRLVQALERIDQKVLARNIQKEHSKSK